MFTSGVGANFGFNHTESGWMKGEAFYYFLTEHLYPRWLEMGQELPVVLVIDGYSAHKDPKLYVWCNEHDVIFLLLYPNSTHILQVLDIAVFGPLKKKYSDYYEDWKEIHPTENFTELEFIKVLKATNDGIIKSTTIVNGWRATGLQPFNFDNIDLTKLVNKSSTSQKNQTPEDQFQQVTEPIILSNESATSQKHQTSKDPIQQVIEPLTLSKDREYDYDINAQEHENQIRGEIHQNDHFDNIDLTELVNKSSASQTLEDHIEQVVEPIALSDIDDGEYDVLAQVEHEHTNMTANDNEYIDGNMQRMYDFGS